MTKIYFESLPKEEQKYYTDLVSRLQKMRDTREMPYKEFDGLTYTQRYDANREAHLAYTNKSVLIDAQNNGDSITSAYDMTTGAVRTKDKSVVSHLLSFNFQANISAYDQDNRIVVELGENTEDLVNRSSEIEGWDEKRRDVYDEFVSQGNVFVRECYEKVPTVIRDNGKWEIGMKIANFVQDDNKITQFHTVSVSQLITGKNVYLSNIRQRNIQKQSEVCLYEEMSWSEAEKRYSKWDRWEFVVQTKGKTPASQIDSIIQTTQNGSTSTGGSTGISGSDSNFWNLRKPEDDIGILHVYNNIEKTYMIIMNGIMMLPVGYSLYEVSPGGFLPIAKADAEVIPNFAYAKGQPDNIIIDGKMIDMAYNAICQKMSQSAKPTMSNNSGKTIPRGLLFSGRLIQGVRSSQFEPLLPPESRMIDNSDSAFMTAVRSVISDKTVDDAFSGDPLSVKTATEFLERKKNTIMKLFAMVEGLANFEEQRVRLRISSIFSKWTIPEEVTAYEEMEETIDGIKTTIKKPTKKLKHRKEFVPTQFKSNGKDGFRDIRFHDGDEELPDGYELAKEEDKMGEELGKDVRISYMFSPTLARLFEWTWKIDVIQKLEEDDKLNKIAYLDNKMRIANLFGVETLNKEYTLQKYSSMEHENPEKAYNMEPPVQAPQPQNVMNTPTIPNPLDKVGAMM